MARVLHAVSGMPRTLLIVIACSLVACTESESLPMRNAGSGGETASVGGSTSSQGGHASAGGGGAVPVDTQLAAAAAALSPGEGVSTVDGSLFAELSNSDQASTLDVQWQTVSLFHDPIHRELQYMGKPASGQSLEHRHYIFDEATNVWRTTGTGLFPGTGHIWTASFDSVAGDYYFHRWSDDDIRVMTRATEGWSETAPSLSPLQLGGSNAGPACALAWHPNLFGPDDGGLVSYGQFRILAWRKATNTWSELASYSDGSPYHAHQGGQGVYLPGFDRVVMGTGNEDGAPLVGVAAGSGGVPGSVSNLGAPPIGVFGGGGDSNHGMFVVHPADSSRLLMLEDLGEHRVWSSLDGGETWTLASYNHPFHSLLSNIDDGQWTIGSIPLYRVVIALTSGHGGGGPQVALWRPND